jgi:hypothetical protein
VSADLDTLDEIIARLQALREQVPGDTRVRVLSISYPGHVGVVGGAYVGRTAKSDPWRTATRGGVPCVLLTQN